jgi:hypothetical protein
MKIKTAEAAKKLAIHPAHLLLHVAEVGQSLMFEDVWPEIDSGWVETVSVTGQHRPHEERKNIASGTLSSPHPRSTGVGISHLALRVLGKLKRQAKWGHAYVPFEALMNLTRLSAKDLADAVAELRKRGLLELDGSAHGPISLNPARRQEIESFAQQMDPDDSQPLSG